MLEVCVSCERKHLLYAWQKGRFARVCNSGRRTERDTSANAGIPANGLMTRERSRQNRAIRYRSPVSRWRPAWSTICCCQRFITRSCRWSANRLRGLWKLRRQDYYREVGVAFILRIYSTPIAMASSEVTVETLVSSWHVEPRWSFVSQCCFRCPSTICARTKLLVKSSSSNIALSSSKCKVPKGP